MSHIRKAVKADKDSHSAKEINEYLDYQLYGTESKIHKRGVATFKKQAELEYELIHHSSEMIGPQKVLDKIALLATAATNTMIMRRRLNDCID